MSLKVFISYAREDKDRALQYYELLAQEGATPWIDIRVLLPGQNWEVEISKAFSEANVVVLLLSRNSVTKRGFVQREANDALERLRYKQPTDIYVIPLLLEPCDVPSHISARLQYVDLGTPGAWEQVKASLRLAAEQQSIEYSHGVAAGPFRIFTDKVVEQWQAAPGHDIALEVPRFESTSRPDIAKELSTFFAGRTARVLTEARQEPWDQEPERFSYTDRSTAMNSHWETFGVVHATNHLLSITYDVGWYGAHTAHPNSHFETFNFCYPGRLHLLSLENFFEDRNGALKRISDLCIQELSRDYWERTGEKPDEGQIKWLKSGAGEEFNNFTAFTVNAEGFTFLFPPYQVSAYALGRWSADVSFYDMLDTLKPDGPHTYASIRS